MPSMKAIKRRITSVSGTKQIMRAMDLVATSKLQKEKERLLAARPLVNEVNRIMEDTANHESANANIYIEPRKVNSAAYIVITGDRGLCGSYNANVLREAMLSIKECKNEKIIAVGTRGWDFFRKRGKNILRRYTGVSDTGFHKEAEEISHMIAKLYIDEEIDEAYVVYTQFESMLSHIPHLKKLLPAGGAPDADGKANTMEYEPDVNTFLTNAVPMYLSTSIYGAMIESAACEQAARMVSMDAATNNATEIIDDLTLAYNRIRQGSITQEINEIVSGANALQ